MKTLKIMSFLFVLFLAACTKEPSNPPCDEPKTCEVKGKFETVPCGWGLYQNYWIRLDNGTLLKPCQTDVALLDINTIYDGMPIELSYYGVKNSSCPESPLDCFAEEPQHETVRLTCIKALGKPRCPEDEAKCLNMGVLYDWRGKLDGCGWVIELNTGEILEVLPSQIDETQFEDDTPVLVGYKRVSRGSICMAGTTVDITCLRVANTTTH